MCYLDIYLFIKTKYIKVKTKYIWGVGVMKDYNLTLRNLRVSYTLSWVVRETGTPKDKDEVNRRDVCEKIIVCLQTSEFCIFSKKKLIFFLKFHLFFF